MFSIKKLTVSGPNKRDSEIVFGNRLTIIQGPSNTGKTMILNCIEYVLGGKDIPISENHGYDTISLDIEKDKCSITFTRKIGENKVSVNSSDETIPSDSYSTKSTDSLNSVLLRLLNINKEVKIISNSNFKRLRLTWNSFRHLFFIDENSIISGNSIIESKHDTSKTALLSSLYYLSTGDSLEDKAEQMSKTIHSARKEGVLEFIKKNLESLKDRKSKLTDNQNKNNNQLDLQKLSSELQELDSEIRRKIEDNNKLLLEITEYREELSNVSLLLARYSDLKSQYLSDQRRLSFIADGEIVSDNGIDGEKDITCPICHSLVHSSPNESYLESARAEFQKIEIQLIELEKAVSSLSEKKELLEKSIEVANREYSKTTKIINKELIPHAKGIEKMLKEYEMKIGTQNELRIIDEEIETFSEQYDIVSAESSDSIDYHPRDYYSDIQSSLQKIIDTLLRECKYTNYVSSEFNLSDMDVIVNGQKKREVGKGYRAYLNSVVAYSVLYHLKHNGKYPLPFLIYDSPILSLKEPDSVSDKMKIGLFETWQKNTPELQIIVIENEVPDIQYLESTQIIKFTKDENTGRYGFLEDVRG